jgi:hypothetical protein
MPLDPVLAQGVAPINFAGPDPATKMNQLAAMMKMQGLQQEGQLNALKLTEAQKQAAEVDAMKDAIRRGEDLLDPRNASKYGSSGLAFHEALRKSQNADLDNKIKTVAYARNLWAGAHDQASYDALLPQLEALRPGSTANLPRVFDPKIIAENVRDADAIMAESKPTDFDRKLIAAGIDPKSPEGRKFAAAALQKDIYIAPTEAGQQPADVRTVQWLMTQPKEVQDMYFKMSGKGQMTPYQSANLEIEQAQEARIAAEAKAKEAAAASAAESAVAGAEESARIVTAAVDEAKKLVSPTSTGFGSVLSGIPTTDARALAAQINTIKANLGFDRLRQMREESKTGGALGSVAVKELERLEAAVAALDTGLKGPQLISQLDKISEHYNNWLAERQKLTKKAGGAPAGGAPTQQVRDAADAIISGGK